MWIFRLKKYPFDSLQDCSDDAAKRFNEKTVRGVTEYREHYFHFPQTELEDESYPFRCRLCIRVFKRRDIFELHLRRHLDTDQKCPYVCVICNTKTFQKHSQMKKHQKNCTESRELPEAVRNLYEQHGLHGATIVQFVCSCGKQSTHRHSHQERTYLLVHFSSYILYFYTT